MIFVSYFLPISFLLLALLTFYIKESRFVIDPSNALIAIWLVVFVLHGAAHGLGLVVLHHSGLLPNMLVTFAALLFSIAFRASRRLLEASSGPMSQTALPWKCLR